MIEVNDSFKKFIKLQLMSILRVQEKNIHIC